MTKPPEFWLCVARDVANTAHQDNAEAPAWNELDEHGKEMLVHFCILAVKITAKHGRASLPYEPVPDDYTPGAA